MILERAVAEIEMLAQKADCRSMPRITISFDNYGDRARFEMEVKREALPHMTDARGSYDMSELVINGIKVRIL